MVVVATAVEVMAVTVMLFMSDDIQGPRISKSFIIFAFSVIKICINQPTERQTFLERCVDASKNCGYTDRILHQNVLMSETILVSLKDG